MNAVSHPRPTAAPWKRRITLLGVIVGIVAVLAMLLPGPLHRIGVLGLRPAFSVLTFGFWLGVLAALFGLVGLLLALFTRPHRYGLPAAIALVLGVVAFAPPLMLMRKAKSVPPIHDISTDTANPPPFQALLPQRKTAPNGADYPGIETANQQHAAYPDIHPMQFNNPPGNTFRATLAVAEDMGWQIAAQDAAKGHIEATATTAWFGFKDDIVIRTQADANGTRVDIRSDSRVGKSDVGANAARIRAFREKLRSTLGHDRTF